MANIPKPPTMVVPAIMPRTLSRFFFPFGVNGFILGSVVFVAEVAIAVGVTTLQGRVASTNGARSLCPVYAVETTADPPLIVPSGDAAGKAAGGVGPGPSPGLDKVIVTLRVVDGLTGGPSPSPGFDKVTVTLRVVVGLAGEWPMWATGAVLLYDASVCWMGRTDGPQNQPSRGASVGLNPAPKASTRRKDSGDSKCARLQ